MSAVCLKPVQQASCLLPSFGKGIFTMSWEKHAIFYHIYPIGFCGAPWVNPGGEPVSRIRKVIDWIPHLKRLHIGAVYFSPLWESGTHGYDTHDYTVLDRRLGTNDDFAAVCDALHENGIRVVVDGVFNHVGRGFFAFQDVLRNGQSSPYCSWFCNLWFGNSNRFGDPFSYESWHGCEELVKLNLRNPDVVNHLESAILGWMDRFHIDGIRFDAADCIDHDFFRRIRHTVKSKNPEFWLMGELIHGNYAQYANPDMLDSATNYECWKGIWSSHNDKNYFEINYAMNRQKDIYPGLCLYNFADNHDVTRLASQLHDKRHLPLVYALLYAMPGIPSIYYGSECGLEAVKQQGSDENLRPCPELCDLQPESNALCQYLCTLGAAYERLDALHTGSFATVEVRNQQLCFRRGEGDGAVYCLLNLQDCPSDLPLPVSGEGWSDQISGRPVQAGRVSVPAFTAMWIAKQMPETEKAPEISADHQTEPALSESARQMPEKPDADGTQPASMTAAALIAVLAGLRRGMTGEEAAETIGLVPERRTEGSNPVLLFSFEGGAALELTGDPVLKAVVRSGESAAEIRL